MLSAALPKSNHCGQVSLVCHSALSIDKVITRQSYGATNDCTVLVLGTYVKDSEYCGEVQPIVTVEDDQLS